MTRFLNWIRSWHLPGWRKKTSSVAPSVASSSSTSKNSSCYTCSSSTTKQVHFADDCGEALERVHIIPCQSGARKETAFHESVEEVYINKQGLVTGFLKVTNLEPGRNVLVRYSLNNWESFKQVRTKRCVADTNQQTDKKIKEIRERAKNAQDDPANSHGKDEELTFSFQFRLARVRSSHVEMAIISTLDGAIDSRHEQCYKLRTERNDPTCIHCAGCWS